MWRHAQGLDGSTGSAGIRWEAECSCVCVCVSVCVRVLAVCVCACVCVCSVCVLLKTENSFFHLRTVGGVHSHRTTTHGSFPLLRRHAVGGTATATATSICNNFSSNVYVADGGSATLRACKCDGGWRLGHGLGCLQSTVCNDSCIAVLIRGGRGVGHIDCKGGIGYGMAWHGMACPRVVWAASACPHTTNTRPWLEPCLLSTGEHGCCTPIPP